MKDALNNHDPLAAELFDLVMQRDLNMNGF